MREAGATHHFVSTVDDLAWILNLRGADVSFNPVFLAHLLIAPTRRRSSSPAAKVDARLAATLAADGGAASPLRAGRRRLAALPESATLLLDPKRVTLGTRERTPARVVEAINPSTLAKSRKSEAEAAHVRRAMAEDGAAMCEFYAWFERALAEPSTRASLTELTIDEKLTAARAKRPGYVGPSFATIAASMPTGRCRTTAPRPSRMRRSPATACC
jgi:Xaa-Pro aminopeptidase